MSLRGNGRGERKDWERIYDYDIYNDLGDPEKSPHHARPILGGSKSFPYPRRGRTGRPLSNKDGMTETKQKLINLDFYVPPDERFSPYKLSEFISNSLQAIFHFVVPEVKSLFQKDVRNFESFEQITKEMYAGKRNQMVEAIVMDKLKAFLPQGLLKEAARITKQNPIKFPLPQVIAHDEYAWKSDEEFAREMLAGLNPVVIKRLETFPPVGRGGKKSSISILHLHKNIGRMTVRQAMYQKRLFMLDHHDYLMPYLKRINEQGVCIYASRTLLFLNDDGTLKPLVIELSLPGNEKDEEINRVFLPAKEGTEAALWQLAKAHVAVNDSGHHQLISHWLHTHAVIEPIIIATRRQLSSMHPIHKLLDPHFKDTMHVNSLARAVLLNSGGILELTMFPGKYSLELTSTIYQNWKFEDQGLPADLLKRGVAIEDKKEPTGIRLLISDYPYAIDGLDIWTAINTYVHAYCTHFYPSNPIITSDAELQSWWAEMTQVAHGDTDPSSWPTLNSIETLTHSLTTIIWIASALHASVNFSQYAYAGYPLNRPTKCRKFIPLEGTPEFANFLKNPDQFFLEMMNDRFTTTLGVALIEVLSMHVGDEVYLGRREDGWIDDEKVVRIYKEFGEELRRVERKIEMRNQDEKLKNRCGPAKVPYMLMYPDTGNMGEEKGITGKGIPNSVSI